MKQKCKSHCNLRYYNYVPIPFPFTSSALTLGDFTPFSRQSRHKLRDLIFLTSCSYTATAMLILFLKIDLLALCVFFSIYGYFSPTPLTRLATWISSKGELKKIKKHNYCRDMVIENDKIFFEKNICYGFTPSRATCTCKHGHITLLYFT